MDHRGYGNRQRAGAHSTSICAVAGALLPVAAARAGIAKHAARAASNQHFWCAAFGALKVQSYRRSRTSRQSIVAGGTWRAALLSQ